MKHLHLLILLILVVNCTSDQTDTGNTLPEPLTDVLTLERSFGDADVPDEFLLARPRDLAVTADGTVLVLDEDRLKVYDSTGRPVKIIGRQGQGPNEFEYSHYIMSVRFKFRLTYIDSLVFCRVV